MSAKRLMTHDNRLIIDDFSLITRDLPQIAFDLFKTRRNLIVDIENNSLILF